MCLVTNSPLEAGVIRCPEQLCFPTVRCSLNAALSCHIVVVFSGSGGVSAACVRVGDTALLSIWTYN